VRRKPIVKLVFGLMKLVRGFRQFSLRAWQNVSGKWTLVEI
jgi:hypothetical protein